MTLSNMHKLYFVYVKTTSDCYYDNFFFVCFKKDCFCSLFNRNFKVFCKLFNANNAFSQYVLHGSFFLVSGNRSNNKFCYVFMRCIFPVFGNEKSAFAVFGFDLELMAIFAANVA